MKNDQRRHKCCNPVETMFGSLEDLRFPKVFASATAIAGTVVDRF